MRLDMKWILGDHRGSRISGPRKGQRFSPAEFRKHDWDIDDAPFAAGLIGHGLEAKLIGKRWRAGRGLKFDLMSRYLSSQVGRAWNNVLSDIRAQLRDADIAEAHWPHLVTGWVAIKTDVLNGDIVYTSSYGPQSSLSDERAPKFYVDPSTGHLHRNTFIVTYRMKQKRIAATKAAELATRMRALSLTRQLHLLVDGNWWDITLRELDIAQRLGRRPVLDVVLSGGLSKLPSETLYGRRHVFASTKRPLSNWEIRRYDLTRDGRLHTQKQP